MGQYLPAGGLYGGGQHRLINGIEAGLCTRLVDQAGLNVVGAFLGADHVNAGLIWAEVAYILARVFLR